MKCPKCGMNLTFRNGDVVCDTCKYSKYGLEYDKGGDTVK